MKDHDKRELANAFARMLDGLSVTQAQDILNRTKSLIRDKAIIQIKPTQTKPPESVE